MENNAGGLVSVFVWLGSTCCGIVDEGLAVESGKRNLSRQSGEQSPEGENSTHAGGPGVDHKAGHCYWRKRCERCNSESRG